MSALATAVLPKAGDVIDGKYHLVRLLGQGGMGAVFAAKHLTLGSSYAVKVMLADAANAEAIARFKNEGRAAANIHNDHVVRVFDVDEENGYAYMVLELLEGEDLAQVLERELRVAPHLAVTYVLQALDGVREAHAQGIVHRDLKPSNLFLAKRRDGSVVVKVLDFGISKAGQAQQALSQTPAARTSTKAMLGSPLYMSPEQLRSSKSVDARADIWAIGVILFELLTGTLPFMGENLGELFAAILENDAPPVRSRAPEVPPGLEAIVARCLQRKPEMRYASATELMRELTAFAAPSTSPFSSSAAMMPSLPGTALLSPDANPAPAIAAAALRSQPQQHQSSPGHGPSGHYPMAIGATTGSGSSPGVPGAPGVKGTVPLGAVTPQPNQGTAAWGSTGTAPAAGLPKTSAMTWILVGASALAFVGLVAGGAAWAKRTHGSSDPVGSASHVATDPPPPPTTSPTTVATASSTSTPVASASAATSASTATGPASAAASQTAPRPHNHGPTPHTAATQVKAEPKAEPPKPDPPKPPPVVTPAPKPTSVEQHSR